MSDIDIAELGKKGIQILIYLFDNSGKTIKKTDLLAVVSSSTTVNDYVKLLEEYGLINVSEQKFGKKVILLSLTNKGFDIAYHLKSIGKSYPMPSGVMEKFKNLSGLTHLNVKDDHIAIEEYNYDHKGHNRSVFVYIKLNGNNILRLWCEVDQSFSCIHTSFAWTLPDVQEMLEYQLLQGNIRRVER